MVRARVAARAVAFSLLLVGSHANAQTNSGWQAICGVADVITEQVTCQLRTVLQIPTRPPTFTELTAVLGPDPFTENSELGFILPHGVSIAAPVVIQVDDGQRYQVPLQRSSAEGLSTTQVIAPDIVQGMLDGQSLNMFLTLASGQTLKLSAPLSEFVVLFGMMQTSPSPVDGEE